MREGTCLVCLMGNRGVAVRRAVVGPSYEYSRESGLDIDGLERIEPGAHGGWVHRLQELSTWGMGLS